MTGVRAAAAAALVLLIVAFVYAPAILPSAGFVSDDFMILQRVRDAGGIGGAGDFFRQSYYEYYRPLGFLSFAADWSVWRDNARASHAVSVALHLLNTLLVFLLGRRLTGTRVGVVAAAVFGLHPAHHEAVYWYAARFDLLATAGVLGAAVLMTSARTSAVVGAGLLFFAGLLAKESAVTFPIVAAAAVWLLHDGRPRRMVAVLAWFAGLGVLYVGLRQASGLPSTGGAARVPKLVALALLPALMLAASHPRCRAIVGWMVPRRWYLGAAAATAVAAAWAWTGSGGAGADAVRGALTAAGFAAVHIVSPVVVDRALMPLPPWLVAAGAVACVAAVAAVTTATRHRTAAFLAWFAVAAYIPVSSMTEGTRYLYLPFVPLAVGAAWAAVWAERRWRGEIRALVGVALLAGGLHVHGKGADWNWAATMTREAARTIARDAAPCETADVVLVTAPARVRGVYDNLNDEALRWLASCAPRSVRAVVRLSAESPLFHTEWADADTLHLRARDYRGGFVTAPDMHSFRTPIPTGRPFVLPHTLGTLTSWTTGRDLHLTLRLTQATPGMRWFVFSDGGLHGLRRP